MKKQLTVFSMMCLLAVSFVLSSCGSKTDEALVTDFNAKKADAQKMLTSMADQTKMLMTDHAAWKAKLDSQKAADPEDAAKIDAFEAEMKKHEDMANGMKPLTDSLNAYVAMNPTTNDALKAASAGLAAQLAAGTSSCNMMMDAHKKLGNDIMAYLAGEQKEAAEGGDKEDHKGGAKSKAAPAAAKPAPAPTANSNAAAPKVMKKSGGGGVIKQ